MSQDEHETEPISRNLWDARILALRYYVREIIACVALRADRYFNHVDQVTRILERYISEKAEDINNPTNDPTKKSPRQVLYDTTLDFVSNINFLDLTDSRVSGKECIFKLWRENFDVSHQRDWIEMVSYIYDIELVKEDIRRANDTFRKFRHSDVYNDSKAIEFRNRDLGRDPRMRAYRHFSADELLEIASSIAYTTNHDEFKPAASRYKDSVSACAANRHGWSQRCLAKINAKYRDMQLNYAIEQVLDAPRVSTRITKLLGELGNFAKTCRDIVRDDEIRATKQNDQLKRMKFFDDADLLLAEVTILCGAGFGNE